jgi:hypothetical protein
MEADMNNPNELSDAQFLTAFEACTLPPSAFNHRAHVRLAWVLLNKYELRDAVERICLGIERFADHAGARSKFNRTLTTALMRLMAHGGAGVRSVTWDQFCDANVMLLNDVRDLLERYYSWDLLTSDAAKQRFVAPDRLPLPE